MQLSRGSLREALRAVHVRIRGIILHGVPSARFKHQRHNNCICHDKIGRVAPLQLRPPNWRSFGLRGVGAGRRKSGVFVRWGEKRHHLYRHKNGEHRVGRGVEESDGNQERTGRVIERVHVQRTRRYLRRLQAR